eukprot:TRINITY_DN37965_c0_g1_i1.p1 TRINITY_DN37965_c0_g1~~TRINITY_DN37965_c0_g1_i1.p1  ORF type:complete len:138 (-),score=11.63 TRINITY_DN37965_c0_g1_i1:167-532(-)
MAYQARGDEATPRSRDQPSTARSGLSRSCSETNVTQGQRPIRGLALLNAGSSCLYMRSNQEYGSRLVNYGEPKFGKSARFSDYLANVGLYKFNGMDTTCVPPSRFMDGSTDWHHLMNGPKM